MKHALRSLVVCTLGLASAHAAMAEAAVSAVKVEQGYFQAEDCTPEADPKTLNECICKADVVKAQVAGVPPAVATVINNQLSQVPEQMAGESCAGKPTAAPASNLQVNAATANYTTVYQSPTVLSVLVNYTTFGAGAAHPSSGSEGYTFDLATGKTINPPELLTAEQMKKANEFIRTELLKKYKDTLFDEAKERTDPYLVDGNCEDCTLYYVKDGWNMRFQLYSIAPYTTGEPEITIPTTIIPAPEALPTRK